MMQNPKAALGELAGRNYSNELHLCMKRYKAAFEVWLINKVKPEKFEYLPNMC